MNEFAGETDEREAKDKNAHADFGSGMRDNIVYNHDARTRAEQGNWNPPGRWPANVVLTHSKRRSQREQGYRKR